MYWGTPVNRELDLQLIDSFFIDNTAASNKGHMISTIQKKDSAGATDKQNYFTITDTRGMFGYVPKNQFYYSAFEQVNTGSYPYKWVLYFGQVSIHTSNTKKKSIS